MIMKKQLVLGLSFVLVSQGCLFSVPADVVTSQKADAVELVSWKEIKGKKLEASEMSFLSALFAATPIGILRMDLVQRSALTMLKEIDAERSNDIKGHDDKEYVQKKITEVIKPVEQFFAVARDYKSIVKPLLEESLGSDCFILHAYETDGDVCKFLESHVETKIMLEKACRELLQFFKDLKESLSENARKAYVELRKQLAAKKKK